MPEFVAVPFVLLSLVGMLIGLISIIHPLRCLYISSRGMGGGVLAACFALAIIATVEAPSNEREPGKQQQAKPVAATNPLVDDGCDLAGAIPNCKEEVIKMAEAQAALAKQSPTATSYRIATEPKPSREELERRRSAAYRRCWANANAAASRNGFELSAEVIANPGLVNANARDMYLSANELIQEQICEAGAKLDNGGYSTFFHKSMYKGADGHLHDLD